MNGSCSWVVVNDPLGVGAFEKDAIFSGEDVANMLRQRTFTLGTVVCHRRYGELTVKLGKRRGQAHRLVNTGYFVFPSTGKRLTVQERFV